MKLHFSKSIFWCSVLMLILESSCQCSDLHFSLEFENPFVHIGRIDTQSTNRNSYRNTFFELGVEIISSVPKQEGSNYQYANIGPFMCETELILDSVINKLDSIKVFSNLPYRDSQDLEITDLFTSGNFGINEIHSNWTQGLFTLKEGPINDDSFEFQFLFFAAKGKVFEFTTEKFALSK